MTPTQLGNHRSDLGLTRAQFGDFLGVSASDVLRWERGIHPLPDAFALAFAVAWVQLCVEASPRPGPRSEAHESSRELGASIEG